MQHHHSCPSPSFFTDQPSTIDTRALFLLVDRVLFYPRLMSLISRDKWRSNVVEYIGHHPSICYYYYYYHNFCYIASFGAVDDSLLKVNVSSSYNDTRGYTVLPTLCHLIAWINLLLHFFTPVYTSWAHRSVDWRLPFFNDETVPLSSVTFALDPAVRWTTGLALVNWWM